MAFGNFNDPITFKAASNFADTQFHVVELTANADEVELTAAGEGIGVVQNHPQSGEAATVVVAGVTKFIAGGAVAIGQRLTAAATGFVSIVTSGALPTKSIGRALLGASSGGIGTMLLQETVTTSGVAN